MTIALNEPLDNISEDQMSLLKISNNETTKKFIQTLLPLPKQTIKDKFDLFNIQKDLRKTISKNIFTKHIERAHADKNIISQYYDNTNHNIDNHNNHNHDNYHGLHIPTYREYNNATSFNDNNYTLEDSFPYPEMRNAQKEILDKLKLCDDKRFIVIEAMPGTGKSAIAKTIASHFGSGYILTATKQLQDQYINEFPDIATIKGKANYNCGISRSLSCKQAECEKDPILAYKCRQDKICPYINAREIAVRTKITATSYAYFFTWLSSGDSAFTPRQILVLDECHLLDSQMTAWTTIKLNVKQLKDKYGLWGDGIDTEHLQNYMKLTATEFEDGWTKSNREYVELVYNELKYYRPKLTIELQQCRTAHDDNFNKLLKRLDHINSLIKQLKIFLDAPNKREWLITANNDNIGTGRELSIQPLYVSRLFKDYVKKYGISHVIFMSATILNVKLFCEELGISHDEVGIIKVDSSFDPQKSPIISYNAGKMNYRDLPHTIPNIINYVRKIIDNHPNERGIIHTGNYRIAQAIINGIKNRRLLMKQGFESNEDLLLRHEQSSNSVLVSPSLSTGTDLKDDLSRFQIIVKLPFMSLGDKRVKRKSELNFNWYVCEMLRTLIQASGRSTRSADDYSTTYILDSSFKYWVMNYKRWLPKQFLERIRW